MTRLIKHERMPSALAPMCRFFRLDPEKITYGERLQILAIYHFVQTQGAVGVADVQAIIPTLPANQNGRSKRKRLYQLYKWCDNQTTIQLGRETTCLRPPQEQPLWNEDEE